MSAGNIDTLLRLWTATLVPYGANPPFTKHTQMYDIIDSMPLGDVQWEHFMCKYNSDLPSGDILVWMMANYEVWYWNPQDLIKNLLSNPDFNGEFDYSPSQKHDMKGNHCFQNFMSGNWAWKQVHKFCSLLYFLITEDNHYTQDIIAEDSTTHGLTFIPVILRSDKTMVSVAMGHNEYWPIYLSIGNIHNNIHHGYQNGIVLLKFLAIPKSMCPLFVS
jgi:Plavaka transposase